MKFLPHNLKRKNDTAWSHSLPGMEERSALQQRLRYRSLRVRKFHLLPSRQKNTYFRSGSKAITRAASRKKSLSIYT